MTNNTLIDQLVDQYYLLLLFTIVNNVIAVIDQLVDQYY